MLTDSFCGVPVAPDRWVRKSWAVTGPAHGAYAGFRSRLDGHDFLPCRAEACMVDPCLIEGILLGPDDVRDPGHFWSQHKPSGTLGSFLDVAANIPEVQARLDAGADLPDLERDPVLGACASIYFDLKRPDSLKLYRGDGFYWFQSNGRHRVLAARIAGLEIPAVITGRIVLKGG